AWTQIELSTSDEQAVEFVLAFADSDGVRLDREDVRLARAVAIADFTAATGQWLDVTAADDSQRRLVLVGAPVGDAATAQGWVSLGGHVVEAMIALRLKAARFNSHDETILADVLLGALLHSFRYNTNQALSDPAIHPARLLVSPAAKRACGYALRI